MAIVTRNMRSATQLTIENLNIPIDLIITREDCQAKPDPEGLLIIADHWNILPKNLIYVGDYLFDLEAAKNAGMMSCLLANQRNEQFQYMADKVIDNFAELKLLF